MAKPNTIQNQVNIKYTYVFDPDNLYYHSSSGDSNIVKIALYHPNLDVKKMVDKNQVYIKDTIKYSLEIKNTGDIKLENIIIKDSIPFGTSYIEKSLYVSVKYSGYLRSGINLNNPIYEGDTVFMSFEILLDDMPTPNPINNVANVSYSYELDQGIPVLRNKESLSNEVVTCVCPYNFSESIDDIKNSIDKNKATLESLAYYEKAKLQSLLNSGNLTEKQHLWLSKSLEDVSNTIAELENTLKEKLDYANCDVGCNVCLDNKK